MLMQHGNALQGLQKREHLNAASSAAVRQPGSSACTTGLQRMEPGAPPRGRGAVIAAVHGANNAANKQQLTFFSPRTSDVVTVPCLVRLWQEGWPLGVTDEQKTVKALAAGYKEHPSMGNPDRGALDNLKQAYLLVEAVSSEQGISVVEAGKVVEAWWLGDSAVLVPGPGGALAVASAEEQQQEQVVGADIPLGSVILPSPFPTRVGKPKARSLDAVCKYARGDVRVKLLKNPTKQAAGTKGGQKRRRLEADHHEGLENPPEPEGEGGQAATAMAGGGAAAAPAGRESGRTASGPPPSPAAPAASVRAVGRGEVVAAGATAEGGVVTGGTAAGAGQRLAAPRIPAGGRGGAAASARRRGPTQLRAAPEAVRVGGQAEAAMRGCTAVSAAGATVRGATPQSRLDAVRVRDQLGAQVSDVTL